MTNPHDPDADARIDEMARAAGDALRHPAPADGVTRARRSSRTKQTTRLALAGTAVVALAVVGVVALGGSDAKRVGPADTVADTSTVPDGTLVTTLAPIVTTQQTSTVPEPSTVGAPEVIYGSSGQATDIDGVQQLIDPSDGSVTGTTAFDPEQSRRVQDARYDQWAMQPERPADPTRPGSLVTRYSVGGVVYETESLPSEITSLDAQDPTALPRFDRCGQGELVVSGATAAAVPERISQMSIGADGRYLVVLSAVCPEQGTLTDGYTTQPYDLTLQVFDAAHPDQAGRTLVTENVANCQCDLNGFSGDGRFLALRSFNDGPLFRVFDLELGTEVGIDQQGCNQYFTTFADTFGPWVGASSLAVLLECDGARELVVRDVAPGGGELRVQLTTSDQPTVEIDVAHFDRPENAWFIVCSLATTTCWIWHGIEPVVELPGVATASFVPLGFRYGG